SVVDDKNNAGEKFKNFRVDAAGFPNQDLFKLAEKLYTDLSTGAVNYKVDDNYEAEADRPAQTDKF
ncbi:hypothetical protein JT06_15755, partial [Desulfobulbus sp. Tol-SR]